MTQAPDRTAIVATTPDDSHSWNLTGIQLELEERGYRVTNLGACTPADLLAETIREQRPRLVVLSSVNGHGAMSIPKVLGVLDQYQMRHISPIVVGGLLTTDPATAEDAANSLRSSGIDGVFIGKDAWTHFDRFVANQPEKEQGIDITDSTWPRRNRRKPGSRLHSAHRRTAARRAKAAVVYGGDT